MGAQILLDYCFLSLDLFYDHNLKPCLKNIDRSFFCQCVLFQQWEKHRISIIKQLCNEIIEGNSVKNTVEKETLSGRDRILKTKYKVAQKPKK